MNEDGELRRHSAVLDDSATDPEVIADRKCRCRADMKFTPLSGSWIHILDLIKWSEDCLGKKEARRIVEELQNPNVEAGELQTIELKITAEEAYQFVSGGANHHQVEQKLKQLCGIGLDKLHGNS